MDVVGTGVEEGVGGEGRTLAQVDAFGTPGHASVGTGREAVGREASGVQPDADGRLGVESLEQGCHIFLFPAAEEVVFEVFWQIHGTKIGK